MIANVEEIRADFIKKVGIVWNKSEGEVEDLIKFDPVVRLLFNAIIFQYEGILNYHSEFKKEVLTDLGKRLLPDHPVNALPSFGIIKADTSISDVLKLKNDKTFSTSRKVKDKVVEQKFIPVADTALIPGSLDALIVNNTFIDISAKQKGDEDYISKLETREESTLWLGISIPSNTLNEIEGVTIFIDYDLDTNDNGLFFNELSEADWSFSNKKCKATTGFDTEISPMNYSSNSRGYGLVRQRVLDFFRKNFISLQIGDASGGVEFSPSLPEDLLLKTKNIVWISARCKAVIPHSFFNDDSIYLNAFPVMNCTVNEDDLTRNEIVKGIKLEENESFFSLFDTESIRSDDFVVRDARYKSFDTKDLVMELRTLSRLFNHSRALFDKTSNIEEQEMEVFRNFSDIVSDIDLRNSKKGFTAPFCNIGSKEPVESFKIFKYLTTYGKYGNGGKVGDSLKYELPGLKAKSIKVLFPFNGGANPVQEEELVDKFRYQLLTRDRIVTRQDIKALCYSIYSEANIETVEIEQTTVQGLGIKGLQRALKISIQLKKTANMEKSQIDFLKKDLLAQLENKSVGEWAFVVRID